MVFDFLFFVAFVLQKRNECLHRLAYGNSLTDLGFVCSKRSRPWDALACTYRVKPSAGDHYGPAYLYYGSPGKRPSWQRSAWMDVECVPNCCNFIKAYGKVSTASIDSFASTENAVIWHGSMKKSPAYQICSSLHLFMLSAARLKKR